MSQFNMKVATVFTCLVLSSVDCMRSVKEETKSLMNQEIAKVLDDEDRELVDCYGEKVQRYNCYQLKVGLISAVDDFYPQLVSEQENSVDNLRLIEQEVQLATELFCEFDSLSVDQCRRIRTQVRRKMHSVNYAIHELLKFKKKANICDREWYLKFCNIREGNCAIEMRLSVTYRLLPQRSSKATTTLTKREPSLSPLLSPATKSMA